MALLLFLGWISHVSGLANTPPMGWNSWNHFGCGISEVVVQQTADYFVSTGLKTAGYIFVNMDDCWMLVNRSTTDSTGTQVPNPQKFPSGLPTTITYVHNKGLKFGLYTSRSTYTCAGYAASCNFETVDANQYATWGVDYVKDDSCGNCRDTLTDYKTMNAALTATGRPIVLSIEGQPDVPTCSQGGYGNLRRVGHDIGPTWLSMTSLVDMGSGLWSYAHNDSGSGGWWNDLDMLEIGNGEFIAETNDATLHQAQAHMTMWSIMKAPLLLGNDLTIMGNQTLAILTNKDALAINQDTLGVQGRRIVSTPPKDQTMKSGTDLVAVLALCNSSRSTQTWRYVLPANSTPTGLAIVACNSSDTKQQWDWGTDPTTSATWLRNRATSQCVDSKAGSDPGRTATCVSGQASQQWVLDSKKHIAQGGTCLDVYGFTGPDVYMGSCKSSGDDSNQRWDYTSSDGLIQSETDQVGSKVCLAVSSGPPGGHLETTDSTGNTWCLWNNGAYYGGYSAQPCQEGKTDSTFLIAPNDLSKPGNFTFTSGDPIYWDQSFGGSGPLPHTRYLGLGGAWGGTEFSFDPTATRGSVIQPISNSIIDDDNVGHVTSSPGNKFCLDITYAGNLEVWFGPLTGSRLAVALFNRSPSDDVISVTWQQLGITGSYRVRDVWTATDVGAFTSNYSATVHGHGAALLILTPA